MKRPRHPAIQAFAITTLVAMAMPVGAAMPPTPDPTYGQAVGIGRIAAANVPGDAACATRAVVQADGRPALVGVVKTNETANDARKFVLARFDTHGRPDTGFGDVAQGGDSKLVYMGHGLSDTTQTPASR